MLHSTHNTHSRTRHSLHTVTPPPNSIINPKARHHPGPVSGYAGVLYIAYSTFFTFTTSVFNCLQLLGEDSRMVYMYFL